MTSPNLNYYIIVGSLCLYVSIYFRIYPASSELFTHARCNVSVHTYNSEMHAGSIVCKHATLIADYYILQYTDSEYTWLHWLCPMLCTCACQNVEGVLHFP